MSKSMYVFIVIIIVVVAASYLFVYQLSDTNYRQSDSQQTEQSFEQDQFDKNQHSLDDPNSPWVIVNKTRPIPTNYIPDDLIVPEVTLRLNRSQPQMQIRKLIKDDLVAMFNAAQSENLNLVHASGYRSAELQEQFYTSYVEQHDQEAADRFSARPGHSEHQTGLAVDLSNASGECTLQICWEDTAEGQWVLKNAHKFGFIIRYQQDKEEITGYQYEPWHLRYVGKELAQELYESGQTMEEFFDVGPAPDYTN